MLRDTRASMSVAWTLWTLLTCDMSSTSIQGTQVDEKKSLGQSSDSNTTPRRELDVEQVADIVLQRLGHTYHPTNRPQQPYMRAAPAGPHLCGGCGGEHRTYDCPRFAPVVINQPTKKWCQCCRWNY